MTLHGEPQVWLEQFPMGKPTPFSQEHLGLVYPGEVVRVDRWSPRLAGPLAGDVYFRIILLIRRRGGLRPAVGDRRIALCLPAAGLSRRRSQLSEELARTRETQAIYLAQRDAESDLIRRTLQRRQEEVEEQLLARRLTPDLIPGLRWNDRVADWAQSIGPLTEPRWNDALQHLHLFSPRLTAVDEGGDFGLQELSLGQDIESIARELSQAQELLALLDRAQELMEGPAGPAKGSDDVDSTAESLDRLSRVLSHAGGGFRAVYHAVRAEYHDYRQLEADLARLRQMAQLGRSAEEILRTQEYLEGAVVPHNLLPSLSIDRQALRAAVAPASLLQSLGRSWGALSRDISGFKFTYGAAYRSHHDSLQQALPAYNQEFETGQRKLQALDLLNTLPELGEPSGTGLAESLGNLGAPPESCPIPGAELDLEVVPRCSRCGLTLDRSLPTAPLARLLTAIDTDLAAKNRRLSNLLVDRILEGRSDRRLDDLLKIVSASDLSALSNTLDFELVEFIHQVIG